MPLAGSRGRAPGLPSPDCPMTTHGRQSVKDPLMPDVPHPPVRRHVPEQMSDRLIVALDVPAITDAHALIEQLDGIVSFFKIGLWLAFAEGVDGLIAKLV